MSEKKTKDKKERTLSLKPGLVSSTNTKGSRSHLEHQQLLLNPEEENYHKQESLLPPQLELEKLHQFQMSLSPNLKMIA